MIIINTTFVIEAPLCKEVLEWIRNSYVASAVHSHALEKMTVITKILNHQEDGSESYAVHIWFNSMEDAINWDNRLGSKLRAKIAERWGQRALAFHTYMEVTE